MEDNCWKLQLMLNEGATSTRHNTTNSFSLFFVFCNTSIQTANQAECFKNKKQMRKILKIMKLQKQMEIELLWTTNYNYGTFLKSSWREDSFENRITNSHHWMDLDSSWFHRSAVACPSNHPGYEQRNSLTDWNRRIGTNVWTGLTHSWSIR